MTSTGFIDPFSKCLIFVDQQLGHYLLSCSAPCPIDNSLISSLLFLSMSDESASHAASLPAQTEETIHAHAEEF